MEREREGESEREEGRGKEIGKGKDSQIPSHFGDIMSCSSSPPSSFPLPSLQPFRPSLLLGLQPILPFAYLRPFLPLKGLFSQPMETSNGL